MTTRDYGLVDAWAMPCHPPISDRWNADEKRQHGMAMFGEKGFGGWSLEEQVEEMDRWGVEIAILSAIHEADGALITNEEVIACLEKYPDRFRGAIAVDPRKPMPALREIEYLVKNYPMVNVKICPYAYGFDNPPNSKLWYPIYAKCCELDISVTVQVGHTGPLLPSEPGRPIYLDEVALTFPELVIIGAHVGWPWEEEMGMVAWKHPNVYVDTSAYAPKAYPERFVKFINKRAPDKVLWGTDYPAIRYDRGVGQLDSLGLSPEVERKFLSDNARKVFKLPASK
jgi:predicted TIM-barrel fold metal-dependent hydrolase